MAYTRITKTRSGKSAIRYAFEEPSRNEKMDRVLMASGSNLDTQYAMMQMQDTWKTFGKDDGKTVQMYRIIQSFGLDELDPKNPEDIAKANEIGLALAAELYPERQALIVTQADGEGGKLHNHVLVNSVSFVDGKSLRGELKEHGAVADKTDEIIERYGMKPIDTEATRNKRTSQEKRMAEAGKYVWKDDLRERIAATLDDVAVTSREEFIQQLDEDHGVKVKFGGEKAKDLSYSFVDPDDKNRTSRASKLGTDYGLNALAERFERNKQLQIEAEEQAKAEEAKRLAAEAQKQADAAKESQAKPSGGFDVDSFFGDSLEALKKPRKKTERPAVSSNADENPLVKRMQEKRAAAEKATRFDKMYNEALAENANVDDRRAQKAAAVALEEAKRKAEQEKAQKEAEDERKRIEALAEAERKEQAEKEQKRREEALGRITDGAFFGRKGLEDVPADVLTRFMENEQKLTGTMRNTITGKELHTVSSIYSRSKMELADEKRAQRQGVEQSVEQSDQGAQADGPDV